MEGSSSGDKITFWKRTRPAISNLSSSCASRNKHVGGMKEKLKERGILRVETEGALQCEKIMLVISN